MATATDRAAALLTLAVALFAAAPVGAHSGGENHRAIVSVDEDAVRALLMMQVPEGRRARGLLARFDLDHDGDLDPVEGQLLANLLGAEVVGGWQLSIGPSAPLPKNIDARATVSESGGLLVALLLEYPPARPNERVRVRIIEPPSGRSPVKARAVVVELQATAGVAESSHPVETDAPVVGPVVLEPGGPGAWLRSL